MRYFVARMDKPEEAPRPSFETHPSRYRHWTLAVEGEIARLTMKVQPFGGQDAEVELKSNSYDLSVDVELADAVQRLRFSHPSVKAVVVTSGHDRIFCAGANIYMLASSSHPFKVNFCKYTNETRLYLEEASAQSGIRFLAPAASREWWTSARCGATWPTPSPPWRRGSKGSGRSSGAWSTRWCRAASSPRRSCSARRRWRPPRRRWREGRASSWTPSSRGSRKTA